MERNDNEHLKQMLKKLKDLQEKNKLIKQNVLNNRQKVNFKELEEERTRMLSNKIEEIRKKRFELEKKLEQNNKKRNSDLVQQGKTRQNRELDMEFIAERGYSRTSYLKVLSAIDGIKENLVKISSIPSLQKILDTNLVVANGLDEVVSAMIKVLPTFFENIIAQKINEIEGSTKELEASFLNNINESKNNVSSNILEKLEQKIDKLVQVQEEQTNEMKKSKFNLDDEEKSSDDELDALELEMNLINNLLFKK